MTRQVVLNAAKGGINRLRTKGGAEPQNLYDLVNGYVTEDGTIVSRPGTSLHANLPEGTKGLTAFEGVLVVYSDEPKDMPDGYLAEVLTHPSDDTLTLAQIHYANPFLGSLYVVAEWSNGDVFHYWLTSADTWEATKAYGASAVVQPSEPNGFQYRANRIGEPGRIWAPGDEIAVGDIVEPTVFNGYKYEAVEVQGEPPRTGQTEPNWPTSPDAVIVESADVPLSNQEQTPTPTPGVPPRYDNPGGSKPSAGSGGASFGNETNQAIQ